MPGWLTPSGPSTLGSGTHEEETAAHIAELMSGDSQVRMAREARATIGALTPEERSAMGLPAVGWEKVVWGGLGWEGDEE